MIHTEPVQVVGSDVVLQLGVSERAPQQAQSGGQTVQRLQLLSPAGTRIAPPARLVVRGREVRVLGVQSPPYPGGMSLITVEQVNPDLPDGITILQIDGEALDDATGLLVRGGTELWQGPGHVGSGEPATADAGGVAEPVDKITLTVPLEAPYRKNLVVRVVGRTPGMAGHDWVMSGEVLDSSASLRKIVCYRYGGRA